MTTELTAPVPATAGAGASPLARCFATTPERFAAEHWNARPLLVRAAERSGADAAPGFDDLLSPADVDELLGPRGLRVPFFSMVRDGVSLPRSAYTRTANAGNQRLADLPDPDGIAAAHADGATIVLNALHRVHPPLAAFCRDLAVELGHQTQVNVYVTPPGAQGFKPHHDTHDVLVLQVDGRKHWTIHPPVVELPLRSQPSKDLGPDPVGGRAPVVDTVLEPGDALYLPRGWLHSAQTTDERSIHLTVGLLSTTWADVLGDLLTGAGHDAVALRHALPLPGQGDGTEVAAFRRAALAWLESLDDAAVERVVAARRARAVPVEPVGALAQDRAARTLGPDDGVRPRTGLRWTLGAEGPERVALAVGRRRISLPAWTEPALREALARPTSPRALAAAGVGIDADDAQVLLRRLLRERVLLPAGPGAAS
ncbi:cupin domain-containing protein [Kineococcus sp. SYSU DK004]|uniref:cupin domain-containing protein n=1 Tax=Kineococcus sp. SYSU DK004 TaxID=3383125 RepID=UPI003D7E96AB